MLDSVASQKTFEECKALVANRIECDPGFKPFYEWCQSHGIPVVILSSGMEPLIRALLASHVGAAASSAIPIVANDVKHRPDGTWEIVYRDPSHFGHDKSLAIRPFREAREKLPAGDGGRPVYFYCGDGLSDLSAARETDLLFAKQGHALITYCQRENVPYKAFRDFNDILNDVKDVFEGRKTPAEIAENS